VKTRTLALIGGRGPIADLVDSYPAKVPGATVTVLQECGHFPMIDDPRAFAEAVTTFLA
jgi:3-oxoadipate enol-lactonase